MTPVTDLFIRPAQSQQRVLRVLVMAFSLYSPVAVAENYIVPIWVGNHRGADAHWTSDTYVTNPNNYAVTLTITDVLPLATAPCPGCVGTAVQTIPPHGRILLEPSLQGLFVVAAAVSFTTTAPVHVEHLVFAASPPGGRETVMEIPTAREWIPAGTPAAINGVYNIASTYRCNLFVANVEYTPREVRYEYRTSQGARKYAALAPARSTIVSPLPAPDCGGNPCIPTGRFPPISNILDLTSDGDIAAAVSCLTADDAVASLAIALTP